VVHSGKTSADDGPKQFETMIIDALRFSDQHGLKASCTPLDRPGGIDLSSGGERASLECYSGLNRRNQLRPAEA
jgi:hypothetical protein